MADLKQLRRIVDKLGITLAGLEYRIGQDVTDKGDIGFNAADAGFAQRTQGLTAGALKVLSSVVILTSRLS